MKTSYMICSAPGEGKLASDGRFYKATICMRGCNTLVYKRPHAALKRLNKAVSKRLYPYAGVMAVTYYNNALLGGEEKVVINWYHRDGTFNTLFTD